MSHSISTGISFGIEFGGTNESCRTYFYGSLQAQKIDGGVSGVGDSKEFTREQIELSKRRLDYMHQEEDLNSFENTESSSLSKKLLGSIMGMALEAFPNADIHEYQEDRNSAYNMVSEFYDELLKKDFKTVTINFS